MKYHIRGPEEKVKFLKEQDGYTEFTFTDALIFNKKVKMCRCEKCLHIDSVDEILSLLRPIHCRGCGRTILKQDYPMFGLENPMLVKK